MVGHGVNLLGGCCGTTPSTSAASRDGSRAAGRRRVARVQVPAAPPLDRPVAVVALERVPVRLAAGGFAAEPETQAPVRPLVVVELDPPKTLNYEPVVRRCRSMRDMGVDAITMADNPVATLHMGNMALAQIVQREADLPVIVHLTCRDHNLLGLQSLLMSAHVMGLHHILALDGRPGTGGQPAGSHQRLRPEQLRFGGPASQTQWRHEQRGAVAGPTDALRGRRCLQPQWPQPGRPNGPARKKIVAGAHFALTQPIYDPSASIKWSRRPATCPAPRGC